MFSQIEANTIFNKNNSPLKEQIITCVKTDQSGLNWIGTLDGLFCFNGSKWEKLTTSNSKLPSNTILCIEINNNKNYIGTPKGLLIINNNNWKVYNTQNSDLPSDKIRVSAIIN